MNVYYPNLWELLILALVVIQVIWAGYLIKGRWESRGESVPVAVALLMWCGMVAVFIAISSVFYFSSPFSSGVGQHDVVPDATMIAESQDGLEEYIAAEPVEDRRAVLLVWCLLFWLIPAGYYIQIVLSSLSIGTVDRIGPFSAEIDEPSEFAEARRLALRGDVDGAVALYRHYESNRSAALLEAARLLKSEDRFADAAKLYDEIADRFPENQTVWAEASLHLARILEKHLMNREAAAALYQRVIEEAPSTRFAQAANTDLNRLQILSQMSDDQDPGPSGEDPDPFFDEDDVRVDPNHVAGEGDPLDDPVPPADPFYMAAPRRAGDLPAEETSTNNNSDSAHAENPAGKKKPAAKKKAAKKKKSATKKRPST